MVFVRSARLTSLQQSKRIKEIKPGVVEISGSVAGRAGDIFVFVLAAYLGHAVYL